MFAHRLCLALGRWDTVADMMASMPYAEFCNWADYFALDPFGEVRDDMRMSRLCWAILQPHSKRRLRESSYMLSFSPRLPPTPEDFRRRADALFTRIERKLDGQTA